MPDFKDLIAELRKRAGLSQEKLARGLNVSLPTINRWEKGTTSPPRSARVTLESYIENLGTEYGDLLERYFDRKSPAGAPGSRPHGAPADSGARRAANGSAKPGELDVKAMEGLLWSAACCIRGEKDAPKFKDYILPLVFIKRLSDVFEDEVARLAKDYGDAETARAVIETDHSVVRFYIPPAAAWSVVNGRQPFDWPADTRPKSKGEQITTTVRAITKANPSLQGVIDIVDYNETRNGEREISDEALNRIIELLSDPRYRLGLDNVEPDFLGRAYEYLLRKFAEGQGQSAGEFFTPREVGWLIAYLMRPQQNEDVYDPCCGSGGLLIKCQLALKEREKKIDKPLKLHGQEYTGSSFAIGRMNMIVHDMEGDIVRGNTMSNPKFLKNSGLRQFDLIVTNPMWNQKNFDPKDYEDDPYERFTSRGGYAGASSADWAWMQHVHASLSDRGRAAVVIDTGAASRGSGNDGDNKEKIIRKWFVDQDLIEAVVLLPDNLFYNTTAAGMILVLNNAKPRARKDQVLLINASAEFQKGRPKNFIPDANVQKIAAAFHASKDIDKFVKRATKDEIAKNDYNLSPSRYVQSSSPTELKDIQALLNELSDLNKQAVTLDRDLQQTFQKLGYEWKGQA